MRIILSIFFSFVFSFQLKNNLSEYEIFVGNPKELIPAEKYIYYELISPLFTDYAFKHRLIFLPEKEKIEYSDTKVFTFPIGTIIVKTFYYPKDFNNINNDIDLVETRLLVHEKTGWEAYPYVWNENDTDAYLSVAGAKKTVEWKNENKINKIDYIVPNMNQCKGCHIYDGIMMPIGPTARQLNKVVNYDIGSYNQLEYWLKLDLIDNLPDISSIHKVAEWNNPNSGTLNDRARAWLDINCAHCHNPKGPANTSGLFLDYYEKNSTSLGIYKTPIAAGRGSGNLEYDIVPGEPENSILIYRFNSTDPGIMMPELGRTMIQEEALELIENWILSLK